ncbi:hypothetical protein IV203_025109 [Nitzschia inconspicua]|uniref:Uncharacterized protein n=1 Tax=Nitzschia inconspicua TaxID=303405 RepID=A0A9K3PZP4_9STRA|nr:hypothetical protein IV203_002602 [Nitzschia inconspicua]KAG7339554.1 hypothetical protein IV203_025147 [Nitzschia inconspicua]KAG7365668.1 hypothetical protein IV203_025109 [Nitzschia inconspicua]
MTTIAIISSTTASNSVVSPTTPSHSVEKPSRSSNPNLLQPEPRSHTPCSSFSSVLFQFEIPGAKSIYIMDGTTNKSPLDDDQVKVSGIGSEPLRREDIQVRLVDPIFYCCDRVLNIFAEEPLLSDFQKELLLDNTMNILDDEHAANLEDRGIDDDLLSEGDLEDDCEMDCYADEEYVVDSKLFYSSTLFVDSSSPFRPPETASPTSSWNRRGSTNYRRELLLDSGFDEMTKFLANFPLNQIEDDVPSEGDIESCCDDDDDEQDQECDSDYDVLPWITHEPLDCHQRIRLARHPGEASLAQAWLLYTIIQSAYSIPV